MGLGIGVESRGAVLFIAPGIESTDPVDSDSDRDLSPRLHHSAYCTRDRKSGSLTDSSGAVTTFDSQSPEEQTGDGKWGHRSYENTSKDSSAYCQTANGTVVCTIRHDSLTAEKMETSSAFVRNFGSGPAVLQRYQYGYDRVGNRLFEADLVDAALSDLYEYDDLNQLTDFARGTLSDSNSDGILDTVASPSRTQAWDLDAMGNWQSLATNGTGQSRTHNAQNQVTGVGSASLTFDANGSMTTDESGNTFVYDAWNRLVEAVDGSSVTQAEYAYDALGRRIVETRPVASTTDHLYYSTGWQVLEERRGGTASGDVRRQYLWSIDYVDAMVARVDYASGTVTAKYNVAYDANWNVTAIMVNSNSGASIQERYTYDPYGAVTILAPSGTVRSSSSYDWKYLHQTGRLDGDTGLYHFRNRDYSPTLGRWTQTDPIGFEAGDTNLYRYVGNGPVNGVDPSGLDRYITDPLSHLHMGVTVDLWRCNPQTGEYYVIGQKSFDFKAGFPYIPGLIVGPGQIDIREGPWIPESRRITIPSNWKEDQELLQQLEQDAKSPPLYSITMYNCRNYAIQSVFKGIEYRSIDRPRPKNPRDEPVTMDDRRNRREQH